MSNGTPPHNGGVWPPPRLRYVLRVMSTAFTAGAACAALTGRNEIAGILAVMATIIQMIDVIGGP